MSDFVLITDATCDLPQELVEKMGINVIPMEFLMDGKSYLHYPDCREMDMPTFYQSLKAGSMATTMQINQMTYHDTFRPILEEGKDILYICFSSGLSGTYNSSRLAVDELREAYPDRKIYTVDSLAASLGEGLLVYNLWLEKEKGTDIDTLYHMAEEMKNRICHWFTVDDLMFLKRGGRVSGAAAVLGSMLGIKPVLHVDLEGHLIPVEKARGRKKALNTLVEKMKLYAEDQTDRAVFLMHGNAPEETQEVADRIREEFHPKEIVMNDIGPIIGSHSGPGTVAIIFVGEKGKI
jgi:DegV family protein with EDD domain